ncbi:TIR domain-containing protein [Rathayibacter festucae]|uniref:TIR domain-containing protein n=1 Tax=Rathayibacter festucae TaxID=110937 RepID=UPI0039C8F49F
MPSLRRGSVASKDFYDSLDRDLAEEAKPSSSKVEAARVPTSATTPSDTRQPATASARSTDSALSGPQPTGASANQSPSTGNPNLSFDNLARRSVFIVRGRDADVHASLASFLKALDLRVITWEAAAQLAGGGSPQTLDIVRAGIAAADAVVVLLTPDDEGRVKAEFSEVTDDPREASLTGQARQNVVFEAGWALATKPNSVILVKIGDVRQLSDIHGLNYVSLTNDISSRRTLIGRLRSSGLAVDAENDDWRSAGSFPEG